MPHSQHSILNTQYSILPEDWPRSPHLIRSLLLQWATVEDADVQERLLETARDAAGYVLSQAAPVGWYWALFPVEPDGRSVSLHFTAEVMETLVQLSIAAGGEYLGRVQPIAHILKTTQKPEGCWQDRVDARTGEPLGKG